MKEAPLNPIFKCQTNRRSTGIGFVMALIFCLYTSNSLFFNPPAHQSLGMKIFLGGLFFLMSLLLIICLKEFITPSILFAATEEGLHIYRFRNIKISPPIFITWDEIRSIEFHANKVIKRGDSQGLTPELKYSVILLKIEEGKDWKTERMQFKEIYHTIDRSVMLDAVSGSPRGRFLVKILEELRFRYSKRK